MNIGWNEKKLRKGYIRKEDLYKCVEEKKGIEKKKD